MDSRRVSSSVWGREGEVGIGVEDVDNDEAEEEDEEEDLGADAVRSCCNACPSSAGSSADSLGLKEMKKGKEEERKTKSERA